MTLLVCSSCQCGIPADAEHCPQCGPQSLTLIISDGDGVERGAAGDAEVPRRLLRALGPQYEVVRLLGRGGFAEVYEVQDVDLQRRLAVKVLRPDIAWTAGMLARFKQEARAIARLNHPHTVPIHFVGEGEGLVFYAMPFVEGRTLAQLLREDGALEPDRALNVAIPVLEALDHAHRHGLVHRDIKPDNVMLEAGTGRPLLLDFGIAKSLDGNGGGSTTQTGFVVGTPLYMSPEQALGQRNIDARTDIYAFGAMFFQMLTGTPPFEGSTSQEIVGKHLSEPVPVPSSCDRRIPVWLSDVIVRCMAKRPADRFESAAAVLEALREGRAHGTTGMITAARVVSHLAAPGLPAPAPSGPGGTSGAGERASGETSALALAETAPLPVRRRRGRLVRWLVAAVVVAVAAAGSAVALRPRPTLLLENRLLEPIMIAVPGDSTFTVAPGDSLRRPLPRRETMAARWWLVRPLAASGRPMGEPVSGTLDLTRVEGLVRRYIGAASLGGRWFAPLVTNASSRALSLEVLLGDTLRIACGCLIPPGAVDARVGYYPLTPEAAVRLRDSAGARRRIDGVALLVDRERAAVPLRVGDADLAAPAPRRSSRDSAAAASPQDDPLRGIFPNR